MCQQLHAVRTFKALVSIGKMPADIAKGSRPQKGIHQSMHGNVSIAVPVKAKFIRHFNPAQNKFAVFRKAVHIKACTYPKLRNFYFLLHSHSPVCTNFFCQKQIFRRGNFNVFVTSFGNGNFYSQPLHQRSVIRYCRAAQVFAAVSAVQKFRLKNLRRLHGTQQAALRCTGHKAVFINKLNSVFYRHRRYGRPIFYGSFQSALKHLFAGKRACAVMHGNKTAAAG